MKQSSISMRSIVSSGAVNDRSFVVSIRNRPENTIAPRMAHIGCVFAIYGLVDIGLLSGVCLREDSRRKEQARRRDEIGEPASSECLCCAATWSARVVCRNGGAGRPRFRFGRAA